MYSDNHYDNMSTYHYQTSKDWQATRDTGYKAPQAFLRDVLEAYDEFINDLLAEAQEAY